MAVAMTEHRRDPSERLPRAVRRRRANPEGNARLTATTGAVLFVLLAAEGVTILRIHALLSPHVFIGLLLVPPVVLKLGSTSWRFARYYLGNRAYRQKGPPAPALRLLGPVLVVTTVAVFASGIALLLAPLSMRSELLFVHKASFVLWFVATAVHVLGHFLDTARLVPGDFYWRTRRAVAGAATRQWAIAGSLVLGLLFGAALVGRVGPWLAATSVH
jgi:hypothetical protein